jgi:hypothetical protein
MVRLLVVLLAACSSPAVAPPPPADAPLPPRREPVPADAAVPFVVPKVGAPLSAHCMSGGKSGSMFLIELDPKTLRGTLLFSTSGAAPNRRLKILGKPAANTTVLVFAGYPSDDLVNIHGVRRPRPRGERLVVGKSVIGSLANIGTETKLTFDGAVDFVTNARFAPGEDRTMGCST